MKKKYMLMALLVLTLSFFTGCGAITPETIPESSEEYGKADDLVTVGFSQLGAESDWRSANTDSMLSALSG